MFRAIYGSYVFLDFKLVVFDHLVAGAYDVFCATIVKIKFDQFGMGEMFFKFNYSRIFASVL